jgi:hypothetical protein
METVWICTENDVLICTKSIMKLESGSNGLFADCITGDRVPLTNRICPLAPQLALLEEIRQAGADDSRQ